MTRHSELHNDQAESNENGSPLESTGRGRPAAKNLAAVPGLWFSSAGLDRWPGIRGGVFLVRAGPSRPTSAGRRAKRRRTAGGKAESPQRGEGRGRAAFARVQQAIQMLQSQTPPRVPPADLVLELESLRWLLLTYAEQASTVEQVRSLTAEKENLQSELHALRKFGLSETSALFVPAPRRDPGRVERRAAAPPGSRTGSRGCAGHRGRGPRGVQRQ